MFANSIKIAESAMFPIFRWDQLSADQAKLSVVGTGFFINAGGYFVSAVHVFDDATNITKFMYMGRLPDEMQNPYLEIKEITRNDENDILVGKVDLKTPKYYYVAKKLAPVGRSVCVGGYPLAVISSSHPGRLDLDVRRYFQPTFVLDRASIPIDNSKGKLRNHNGFLVRDEGLFGMSGGPVFDKRGFVVGMQGSVTKRESKNSSGRTIIVENAVVIKSELIYDLLKKNKIRFNFLGRF